MTNCKFVPMLDDADIDAFSMLKSYKLASREEKCLIIKVIASRTLNPDVPENEEKIEKLFHEVKELFWFSFLQKIKKILV